MRHSRLKPQAPSALESNRHSTLGAFRSSGSNLPSAPSLAVDAGAPALLPRTPPLPALPGRRINGTRCCSYSVAGIKARGGTTGGGGTGGDGRPGRPGDCSSDSPASASACSILAKLSKHKPPLGPAMSCCPAGDASTNRAPLRGPKKKSLGLLPGGWAIRSFASNSWSSLSDATVEASLSLLVWLQGLSASTS